MFSSPAARPKLLAVLVAAATVAAAGGLSSRAGDVAEADQAVAQLPADAESRTALERSRTFASGRLTAAVVVLRRDGGQTEPDRRFVEGLARQARGDRSSGVARVIGPESAAGGELSTLTALVSGQDEGVTRYVELLRERAEGAPSGLRVLVTGPAGFRADAANVFAGIDGRLLAATALLVLILLIAIYRSPVFWTLPFVTVVLCEGASRGAAALLSDAGVTVTGQATGVASVLTFGAATDYALLLVARYREELAADPTDHRAAWRALRGAAPAIVASSATVVLALLCLLLADVGATRAIGPLSAVGVLTAALLTLTLLPALLVLTGRRAFWPRIPRYAEASAVRGRGGSWDRLGRRLSDGPRRAWIAASLVLVAVLPGLLTVDLGLSQGERFAGEPDAVTGQRLLAEALPAGVAAPLDVFVGDRARAGGVADALRAEPQLVDTVAQAETGPQGTRLAVVLTVDPFGQRAEDGVPTLRQVARRAGGTDVLVGGPTAQQYDFGKAASDDNLRVMPIALVVVLLVLIALLRAVVLPILLVVTVVASFLAAFAIGAIASTLLGFAGQDPTLPLLAFVFLVALGVDYNIFLLARAREEVIDHGNRDGMLRALTSTGGVITSAGIVLAGTFSALAIVPFVALVQLGVTIAVGVLIDTLLVRSVLVPALVLDIGPRVWWPSALGRRSAPVDR